ncbi:MAG: hypothetical protein DI628_01310 [Blastochloris viridis]|uniref:Uncharacterized protein n=1 Tax=Blastochloris viridis TaxID=1079 RepID=A0A6N4RC21_BLAVI|nr:MAG: hypothetical protein DI628_01310 [Blastochloris viridis]
MTDEPTPNTSQPQPAFYNLNIQIGPETYAKIQKAMEVSGTAEANNFINRSIMEHIKQIELAHSGTLLRTIDTVTFNSDAYFSAELHNAFEHGRQERESVQAAEPPRRPALTLVK